MFGINAFIFGFDRGNFSHITPTSAFLLEVDAYLSENHSYQSIIPDHPVQADAPVNEHIILLPPVVNISGIITDTPLLGFDQTGQLITPQEGRSIDKINSLLEMREARELFSVSTTLGVYKDYFFLDLNIPFTPEDGYSARFSATLKKFRLVTFRTGQKVLNQSKEVSARAAEPNDVGTTTPPKIVTSIGAALF